MTEPLTLTARRILFGVALSAVGGGLTMPLLIVYLGEVRGLGTGPAGLIVGYIAAISLIAFPVVGWAADRFGPRPILMVGLLVEATGIGLLAFVDTLPKAFAATSVLSLGGAMAWPSQSALLGRVTAPEARERVFGIQFMLLNLGLGLGGLVSALVVSETDARTFQWLYAGDAASFLLYFAVLLTLRGVGVGRVAHEEGTDAGGFREVIADRRLRRLLVLSVVLLTSGYGALEVGVPVFITVINDQDVSWVGASFAANTFTIVLCQLFVLRWIKGRSRSMLLVSVAVIWAASWLLIGSSLALGHMLAIAVILIASALFAVGETIWAPVAPSLVNDLAPDRLRGRYNSTMSLVWSISGIIGPGIAGLMLGAGLSIPWIALLLAGCAFAGFLSLRLRRILTPALDGREVGAATGSGAPTP